MRKYKCIHLIKKYALSIHWVPHSVLGSEHVKIRYLEASLQRTYSFGGLKTMKIIDKMCKRNLFGRRFIIVLFFIITIDNYYFTIL